MIGNLKPSTTPAVGGSQTPFLSDKALWFIVACFVLIAGFLVYRHDTISGSTDPVEYLTAAEDIWHYDSKYHPPLYPAAVGLVNLAVRDVFLSGKIVSLLSGVGLIIVGYLLSMAVFGDRRIAILTAALTSISPYVVEYSYLVRTDMLAATLLLTSIWLIVKADQGETKWLVIGGVIAGLAYLTKYVFGAMAPAVIVSLFFLGDETLLRKLTRCAYFMIPFLLAITPWTVTCLLRHGNLHNYNYVNVAFAALDNTGSWLKFRNYESRYSSLFSLITAHPKEILAHALRNAALFPKEILVKQAHVVGLVALAGSITLFYNLNKRRIFLFLAAAAVLAPTLLTWFNSRFYIWLLPIIFMCGSYVIFHAIHNRLVRNAVIAAALLGAAALFVMHVPADFRNNNFHDLKNAGLYLATHSDEDDVILASSKNIAWYAHRRSISLNRLGEIPTDSLEAEVAQTDATIFVYTERETGLSHPNLKYLLDPKDERVPRSWSLFYQSSVDAPVVAYRVKN